MIASAIGESKDVSQLMAAAEARKPPELITSAAMAADFESSKCRDAVRGFRSSSDQSTISFAIEQPLQRTAHLPMVCAVLRRQQREAERFEIYQGVADN